MIYFGGQTRVTHLMRYAIDSQKSVVMEIPSYSEGNALDGAAVLHGDKTYFSGTLIKNQKKINFLLFLAFEDTILTKNTMFPLDSLQYNKTHRPKGRNGTGALSTKIRYAPPVTSVSYTPIILKDGNILILQDLFSEQFYTTDADPRINNTTKSYESGSSKIFMGFENYTSLALKYSPEGTLLWDGYYNNGGRSTVSLIKEKLSYIRMLDSDEILVIQPAYDGYNLSFIFPFDEEVYSESERIPTVDPTEYPRQTKKTFRLNTKKILPVLGDKFLFHGYDITQPLFKKRMVVQQACFQLLYISVDE